MKTGAVLRATIAIAAIVLLFGHEGPEDRRAFADPPLSGAESTQVVNGDFSGAGAGEVGTPPANHDFETASATVGTPPTNHNLSAGDFTGWTLTGSPTIQSGGPGGYYAQLASGQKIKSSAFTVAATAQTITVNVAAVSGGTFQWKFNIWSGADYSTKTMKAFTSCPTTCTNWNAYSIDIVPWAGSSIKVEVERYLGDLKTDDVAVGQEVLVSWSPVAGDRVGRQTGGPSGAYAKTTTAITSAAFTVDTSAQNASVDTKIDGVSGTYTVDILSGPTYGDSTSVFSGTYANSSTWSTKAFGIGSLVNQTVKIKIVPGTNTTLLVDNTAVPRNEIAGWTTGGTSAQATSSENGSLFLSHVIEVYSQPITLDFPATTETRGSTGSGSYTECGITIIVRLQTSARASMSTLQAASPRFGAHRANLLVPLTIR